MKHLHFNVVNKFLPFLKYLMSNKFLTVMCDH